MKLSSKKALSLLLKYKNCDDHGWVDHSICVGNTAYIIADALGVDADKARAMGYIHDIGKGIGDYNSHIINGYNFIKDLGYDIEYANICLTHSYLNNDIFCTCGVDPTYIHLMKGYNYTKRFVSYHKYNIYDKIINLCDLMCTSNVVTIDKRLIDVILRRGVFSNAKYHITEIYKLKEYFDNLLGYNLYDLFPEIKNNL
jgi:putative nucleotidyltransferase with HDIG domain